MHHVYRHICLWNWQHLNFRTCWTIFCLSFLMIYLNAFDRWRCCWKYVLVLPQIPNTSALFGHNSQSHCQFCYNCHHHTCSLILSRVGDRAVMFRMSFVFNVVLSPCLMYNLGIGKYKEDIFSVNISYYWCILSLGLQLLRGLSFLGRRIFTSKSLYQY